ncbi:helicase C-terminal domain-containing protein [Vibrio sp. SS-MA-C1-2]
MTQSVGRLIRSKEDKGIIVILDNQLIQKGYGKQNKKLATISC